MMWEKEDEPSVVIYGEYCVRAVHNQEPQCFNCINIVPFPCIIIENFSMLFDISAF